jgi:hypothetical protein
VLADPVVFKIWTVAYYRESIVFEVQFYLIRIAPGTANAGHKRRFRSLANSHLAIAVITVSAALGSSVEIALQLACKAHNDCNSSDCEIGINFIPDWDERSCG